MKIVRNGQAGTLESGDVMVIVSPRSSEDGAQLELDVHSIVEAQAARRFAALSAKR